MCVSFFYYYYFLFLCRFYIYICLYIYILFIIDRDRQWDRQTDKHYDLDRQTDRILISGWGERIILFLKCELIYDRLLTEGINPLRNKNVFWPEWDTLIVLCFYFNTWVPEVIQEGFKDPFRNSDLLTWFLWLIYIFIIFVKEKTYSSMTHN